MRIILQIKLATPARNPCWIWLLPLFCLLPLLLNAQPQVLPSVSISSDEAIQAPLQKRTLVFPQEVPPDSLSCYLPRGVSLQHKAARTQPGSARLAWLRLAMDTSFGASVHGSFYPQSRRIPLLAWDSQVSAPGGDRFLQNHQLHAQTRIAGDLLLAHDLSWQKASQDSLHSTGFGWTLTNHYPLLQRGKAVWSELDTQLALDSWQQKLGAWETSNTAFSLSHSQRLAINGHGLNNALLLRDSAFGFQTLYHYPFRHGLLSNLQFGLLTDLHHLLPALDWQKRVPLAPNKYLEFANLTALSSPLDSALGSLHPYTLRPEDPLLTLIPLNFTARAFQIFPRESSLRLLGLSHTLRYLYNQPQVFTLPDSLHTALTYADLWDNRTRLELRLQAFGLDLEQDLELHFENLPAAKLRRPAYSPLLRAETRATLPLREAGLSLSFVQEYFQQDEYTQALPAVLDLSLALHYPISSDLQLTARLANIFNTHYRDFGALPDRGRELFLTLGYALNK